MPSRALAFPPAAARRNYDSNEVQTAKITKGDIIQQHIDTQSV